MQISTVKFTKDDLAKYPFLKETQDYVKQLDLKIEDLVQPEYANILERAKERVEEAILFAIVGRKPHNEEIEIPSFPVAILLAIATENSFIKKRYALAEAMQSYYEIDHEKEEKLLSIAKNFNWALTINTNNAIPYAFALKFNDYLRNTTHLRETEWKLISRPMLGGNVYLMKNDVVRLLREEVRKYIEKRLEMKELPPFPQKITKIAEKIKSLSVEKIGKAEMEGFPRTVVQTAFPPCVKALYDAFSSGRHLSHIGRFTLTSFLINIGMQSEDLIQLFRNVSDFNEKLTRYQVEHIAGERGSRTRYTSPKCETLKTHSVCVNPDEICQRINHPLTYYRRKLRLSGTRI